ncbi:Hypothetical_protein [Hexamita inflata]|uniref:Hypothetical_protein n=1 Tax=Hexamita inflata TaxID=28002 RepID=A0AA86NEQ5_9EUKA|nr:Hypothetical protein HINF_LOCUS5465 [Hexamita inflata]
MPPKGSSSQQSSSSKGASLSQKQTTASIKSTPQVRIKSNGTFDQRSSLFKSGEAYLKKDGTLDGRCSAAKKGIIGTTPDGLADYKFEAVKYAPRAKNKSEVVTSDLRMTNRQKAYSLEHPIKNPEEKKDVDHIVSLKIVNQQIGCSKSSLNEQGLKYVKDAFNTNPNFKQRNKEVNRVDNNEIDDKIIQALQGDDVTLNKADMQRLSQQVKASKQIMQDFPDSKIIEQIATNLQNLYTNQIKSEIVE